MQTEIRKASFGLVFVSGILLFIAFALVAWLFFRFNTKADAYDEARGQERLKKLAEYRKGEADKLGVAGWVDQGKGIAKVPIDQAMRGVVVELKAKPVGPSKVKVDDPYPYGLAAPKPAQPAPADSPKSTAAPSESPAAKPAVAGTPSPGDKAAPAARSATVDSAAPANQSPPNPAPSSTPASSATPSTSAAPTPPATSPQPSPAQP